MSSPADVVDRQLTAYNAGDAVLFAATYHPEAVVLDDTGHPRYQGRAQIQRAYADLFAREPALTARVVRRIALDPWVIDEEEVTGRLCGQDLRAVAIYEVVDGLITTCRVLQ